MEKEKLKKLDIKEEVDSKKLEKKFKEIKEWAIYVEAILLLPVVAFVLLVVLIAGEKVFKGTNEIAVAFLDTVYETNDNIEYGEDGNILLTNQTIIDLSEKVRGSKFEFNNKSDEYKIFVAIVGLVIACIDYIMMILIINNISRIFGTIEKEGTPFTKNNVKYLNMINILALLLCVFGTARISMNLVSVIIISAITIVFKYGCKLQQEYDETL